MVQKVDICSSLYLRNSTYCFRWVIPENFRPYLGLTEIKRSLRTRSGRVALIRAQPLFMLVEDLVQLRNNYYLGGITEEIFKQKLLDIRTSIHTLGVKNINGVVEPELLFHDVLDDFITAKIEAGLTCSMIKEYQMCLDTIKSLGENLPLKSINAGYIRRLLNRYSELPKRNINPYKDKSIHELLKLNVPIEHRVSGKTVVNALKLLQGVFVYARAKDLMSDSPAQNLNLKLNTSNRYGVFSDEEMRVLLGCAANYSNWKKWVIYLAAYTGARRAEIVQLRKQDVKLDDSSGIHYFLITPDAGSVKTSNSIRYIPIHSLLIEEGFLKYAESFDGRIFPKLKVPSVSAWLKRLLKDNHIPANDQLEFIRVYHSFRHTFITKARASHSNTTAIQQVIGHESAKAGVTDRYTHQFPLGLLKEVVDSVKY